MSWFWVCGWVVGWGCGGLGVSTHWHVYGNEAGDNGVTSHAIDRGNNPNVSETQVGDNVSPLNR